MVHITTMNSKIAALVALGIAAGSAYGQDKAEGDAKLLLGTWKVISVEDNGRKAPAGEMPDMKWVITTDKISVQKPGFAKVSAYKIDPAKSPKWIDIEEGDHISKAIYELEGDQLKVCVSEVRELGRPTALESKPDSANDLLFTLERAAEIGEVKEVAEIEDPADPAEVPKGLESLNLSKTQAGKITAWLKKQSGTPNPSDLATFVQAQLRKDQREAFRKLLETGGAPGN